MSWFYGIIRREWRFLKQYEADDQQSMKAYLVCLVA